MASIRSSGNRTTEARFAALLRENRITGWRRRQPLPGRPDFAFPGLKVAVFVDGCFWHGCPRCYRAPHANRGYWAAKVERNRARDGKTCRQLRARGWVVIRVWEHSLRGPGGRRAVAARLRRLLSERECSRPRPAIE
ncbi:MAG: very short patch repair endonuclease [Terriglobales bacterium]